MRPLPVVAERIQGEDAGQMSLAEDQHSVGGLRADRHEAFGKAVRPRARGGILTTSIPASARYRESEAEAREVFAEVDKEVAGMLDGPGPSRCPVTPRACS